MKIGVDIRAAIHEPAGIGTLALNFILQLETLDKQDEFFYYTDVTPNFGPSPSNVRLVGKSAAGGALAKMAWHARAAIDAGYARRLDRFISFGSLQVAALTRNLVVLVVPDISHILYPGYHVAKSRITSRMLMKAALRNARAVIAISNHTKKDILDYMQGSVGEAKVAVAHAACDEIYQRKPGPEDIARVKTRYRLPDRYVLSVGTLEPRKNISSLVKAFAVLVANGCEHELVLAGRKGWLYEGIFGEVRKSGLESRIRFLGFVPLDDMPALYAMADVFVYPSLYEGFGIPPLEAMTCGVPVITSNVSSLPEVTGDAALLIDPLDIPQIARNIKLVLDDAALRGRLSRAGMERATLFSWKRFAGQVLTIALQ